MDLLSALEVFNYVLVLIYGLFLSTDIAGGWENDREKRLIFALCPILIAIQGVCWLSLELNTVERIYPLIVHFPLFLVLTLLLKKPAVMSVVSICTAYLCCQLPRWAELTVSALTRSPLAGAICYTISIIPIFFALQRFFVKAAHDAMTHSRQSMLLFGSLPFAYYLFDYTTVVYSDILYAGNKALHEFLPTALIIFYVMFLTAYYVLAQKRMQTELQSTMLEAQLRQSRIEMENLRSAETQAAIYQHDMRHHLNMLEGLLSVGKPKQAEEYIKRVRSDLESITLKRYCENETVNLLCSSFSSRAESLGINFTVRASLPSLLPIPDTEICSIVSNGLENAFNAVASLEGDKRTVSFYCGIRQGKLLIEIINPYSGDILMRDDIPVSKKAGHGYGCSSIRTIVEQRKGLCSFETDNGIFILRIVLPVQSS